MCVCVSVCVCVCVCIIYLYTSLHVEMHEFIFNRDVYDVVIEKVVGYPHSLMRFYTVGQKLWCVCLEGPCNMHKTLSSYTPFCS